ncbi:MAG: dienelactone hydrolase family protein [Phycisphaeraceae bacterium]
MRSEVVEKSIAYTHDGVELEGYYAYDDAVEGPRPGVLVIHQWWGLGDYEKRRARQLAELGYAAFALDMYGKGQFTQSPKQASEWAGTFYQDRALGRSRAAAGLAVLRKQAESDGEKLAAIGYCFGGSMAIELAFSGADIAGAVSFHGNPKQPAEGDAERTQAELLICHGAEDPLAPLKDVVAFTESLDGSGVDWTLAVYSNAVHSFTEEAADEHGIDGVRYDARANDRSWRHMRAFFDALWRE